MRTLTEQRPGVPILAIDFRASWTELHERPRPEGTYRDFAVREKKLVGTEVLERIPAR